MYLHHQQINLGALTAFFLYVNRFFSADPAAGAAVQHLPAGPGVGVQAAQPARDTSPRSSRRPTRWSSRRSAGEIRFDHVSFGYDPAVPVLHDVDLTIDPGETVAFVGATGAGKSTMAKLVTRFYDPTAGRVLIDGYDLQARDARVAALASSASCPRSRSSSPGPSGTTSPSPGRARPTTRCGTPCTRWA